MLADKRAAIWVEAEARWSMELASRWEMTSTWVHPLVRDNENERKIQQDATKPAAPLATRASTSLQPFSFSALQGLTSFHQLIAQG